MQRLSSDFRDYLLRVYASQARQIITGAEVSAERNEDIEQAAPENGLDENGSRTSDGKLKIVIDWGALDVDREPQTISGDQASDSIVKLLCRDDRCLWGINDTTVDRTASRSLSAVEKPRHGFYQPCKREAH